MGDNVTDEPGTSADPHDWHMLDVEAGLECRQTSAAGEPNRWEVRQVTEPDEPDVEYPARVLDDEGLQQLLGEGPNPAGL